MGQREQRIECWFLLPLLRNSDHELHPVELWGIFRRNLQELFQGWSGPVDVVKERIRAIQDVSSVPGGWVPEADKVIEDESRKYTVIIPSSRVEELRGLLEKAANSFDQEEILCIVQGIDRSVPKKQSAGFLDGDLWAA